MEEHNIKEKFPVNRTRKRQIAFAVSEEEFRLFSAEMDALNIKSWRIFFLIKSIPGYTHKENKAVKNSLNQFIYQLSRIANNLNQIQSVADKSGIMGYSELDESLILETKKLKFELVLAFEKKDFDLKLLSKYIVRLKEIGVIINDIATRINRDYDPFFNSDDRKTIIFYRDILKIFLIKEENDN